MERWQLSQKEIARYGVIENTIEGYLKADLAAEELCLSIRTASIYYFLLV